MKKPLYLAMAAISALSIAGCSPQQQNAGTGALVGGAAGAVIGGVATGRAGGALAGAAIGAAGGAIVGAASTPSRRCAQYGYDYAGNAVCTAYY